MRFRKMSTSSGPDEEYEHLKEAIDPEFLPNDLFRTKKQIKEKTKPAKLPPSLRNINDPSSSFNPLEIKVSPEFKAYVSRHLRKTLDKLIDDTEELKVNGKRKCKKKDKTGNIKLLRTSRDFISNCDEESPVLYKRKYVKLRRRSIDDSSSGSSTEEKRVKEVAVTAEWILSGKATEGWAPNTKGKVEIISVPVSKN